MTTHVYGPGGVKDPTPPVIEGYQNVPTPRPYTQIFVGGHSSGVVLLGCPDCGCLVSDAKIHDRVACSRQS